MRFYFALNCARQKSKNFDRSGEAINMKFLLDNPQVVSKMMNTIKSEWIRLKDALYSTSLCGFDSWSIYCTLLIKWMWRRVKQWAMTWRKQRTGKISFKKVLTDKQACCFVWWTKPVAIQILATLLNDFRWP